MPTANPNQSRTPIYWENQIKGQPVAINGKTSFSPEFPRGPGVYATRLRFNLVLTVGTGTTPLSETTNPAGGLLNWVRQILLKGDNGDIFVDNLPIRPLYKISALKSGSPSRLDAMAAANGTYRVDVVIFHADPQSARPEDTIMVTRRYKSMFLDLITGPLTDLLGTVGTATATCTVDVDMLRTQDDWDEAAAPVLWYQSYSTIPAIDASAKTNMDLDKDENSWLKRLYVHTCVNGVAGQPWFGTNSDAIIQHLTVKSGNQNFTYQQEWLMLQDDNKDQASLETVLAGVGMIDLMRDRSNLSALYTMRNQLQLTWTNQGGVGANNIVTVLQEHRRNLHNIKG